MRARSISVSVRICVICLFSSMAEGLHIKSHPLRSTLLGSAVVPVHQILEADIGHALLFEQRCWLHFLDIPDQVKFRKNEMKHEYIQKLLLEWGLDHTDFYPGGNHSTIVKTRCFSIPLLISWLFMKVHSFFT